ncbi:hypothetical protein D3C78_1307430 [compost metagenome]
MRGQAAGEVEAEVDPASQRRFQGEAADEQEDHVAQQMVEAAVQEHGAEQSLDAELVGDEAEALGTDAVPRLLGRLPRLLPGGIGLVGGGVVQPVFELQIAQDDGGQVLAAQAVDAAALVGVVVLAGHQVVDVQGALAVEQAAVEIELLRLIRALLVRALVEDVDQDVEQDQQQGDDRRAPPVQGLLGGQDDHGAGLSCAGCRFR